MLLRQYSSHQPLLVLTYPAIVAAILLPAAFGGRLSAKQTWFPLDLLVKSHGQTPMQLAISAGILIVLGAFFVNFLYNKYEFQNQQSYVPGMFYSLAASAFCLTMVSLPGLLANVFLIFGLYRGLAVHRQTRALGEYFETGFWFGMGALSCPPLVALLPTLWVMVLFTRAFNWRELLLPALGFLAPFLYWAAWQLWFQDRYDFVLFRGFYSLALESPYRHLSWGAGYFYISVLVILLLSYPGFFFLGDRASNKSRNLRFTFLWFSVGIFASFALGRILVYEFLPALLLLPLSIVGGLWFSNYRYSLLAPFAFYFFLIMLVLLAVWG
jgi:hypothetical protein